MHTQKADPLNDISTEDLKFIILTHSAIAGAGVAAVVQISSREQVTLPLLVSLACFAIAIPFTLLVVLLINYRLFERARWGEAERRRIRSWPNSQIVQAFRYLTYTACFGGFLAIFWSFHAVIALIFLISVAIALGVALAAENFKSRQSITHPAGAEAGRPSEPGI